MAEARKSKEERTVFYDVREAPFEIYGLYAPQEEGSFRRMPDGVASRVNEGVALRNHYTAGGRVRFSTDAEYIVVSCTGLTRMHYADIGVAAGCGFDLYIDDPNVGGRVPHSIFVNSILPPESWVEGHYEVKLRLPAGMHAYTLNFPLFNTLSGLRIGVNEGATVGKGLPYVNERPIVFYGSSITHGAAASRPGMAYPSIVSRRLNADFHNLGFGGSARGETAMAEFIAWMDPCCLVLDYDFNAPNAEHLRATHYPFYKLVREAHPGIPIVLMSAPSVNFYDTKGRLRSETMLERRDVIIDTFRKARREKDSRVWFIDGEGFFSGPDETDCTVDALHPTDLGMTKIADAVHRVLLRILNEVPFLRDEDL